MIKIRVLGIDPGLATTGWGMVEGSPGAAPKFLASGHISTPAGLPLTERLLRIQQHITRLIVEHRPDHFAVEELFFTKHAASIAATAQARGVILLTAAQQGLQAFEYNPRTIKIAITGYGSAEKKQIQLMVQRLLKLAELPKPDDMADALAIAICHLQTLRLPQGVEA